MSMFDDPGNLLAIAIILILGYFIFKKRPAAVPDAAPAPAPEPVPAPNPDAPDYETIYNNKYPKADILYDGRKVPWRPGRYNIDVRNFFNRYDSVVRRIADSIILNKDIKDNAKALLCLNWVLNNINYASDLNPDGSQTEYWNFAFETLLPRNADSSQLWGDCEDASILLANLMLASGIPYWKIRLVAADVDDGKGNAGGHCFVVFFDETRIVWVLLDATFYANRLAIEQRPDYKTEPFYKNTWFSFNERYSFAADTRVVTNMKNIVSVERRAEREPKYE